MQVSRFTRACENILRVPAPASCVARTGVSAPHSSPSNSGRSG